MSDANHEIGECFIVVLVLYIHKKCLVILCINYLAKNECEEKLVHRFLLRILYSLK